MIGVTLCVGLVAVARPYPEASFPGVEQAHLNRPPPLVIVLFDDVRNVGESILIPELVGNHLESLLDVLLFLRKERLASRRLRDAGHCLCDFVPGGLGQPKEPAVIGQVLVQEGHQEDLDIRLFYLFDHLFHFIVAVFVLSVGKDNDDLSRLAPFGGVLDCQVDGVVQRSAPGDDLVEQGIADVLYIPREVFVDINLGIEADQKQFIGGIGQFQKQLGAWSTRSFSPLMLPLISMTMPIVEGTSSSPK